MLARVGQCSNRHLILRSARPRPSVKSVSTGGCIVEPFARKDLHMACDQTPQLGQFAVIWHGGHRFVHKVEREREVTLLAKRDGHLPQEVATSLTRGKTLQQFTGTPGVAGAGKDERVGPH